MTPTIDSLDPASIAAAIIARHRYAEYREEPAPFRHIAIEPPRRKRGRPFGPPKPPKAPRLCGRCGAPCRIRWCAACAVAIKREQTYRSLGRAPKTKEEISAIRKRVALEAHAKRRVAREAVCRIS